ncbi:hypothetical protein B0H14DRAFT_3903620 [Mycena olivaceomarginata]|nr:hypothetical protein B0H14DRAFT_3903620 [Mycena olivaceomarginata]
MSSAHPEFHQIKSTLRAIHESLSDFRPLAVRPPFSILQLKQLLVPWTPPATISAFHRTPFRFIFLNSHLHAETVTRPASPDLLYGFEVVHREDGADDDQWPFKRASPFRSLLPRIWDVIPASPPRASYLFKNKSTMLSCLLSTAKKAKSLTTRLVFSVPCDGDRHPVLTLLPPELSLHILNLLLFPSGSSSPLNNPYQPLPQQQQQAPSPTPTAAVPSTPVPLTLEQQHITAVEGIVPTLQKIVAIVNSDCSLDLKTIARNAEYNPSSGLTPALRLQLSPQPSSRSSPAAPSPVPWGVPSSPPTRPSRPSPPPRTSSLVAARMKKLPPLPPDAASPLPLTPSPASAPSWRALYRARLALERCWGSPAVTNEIAWQSPGARARSAGTRTACLERAHGGHRGVLCPKFDLSSAGNLQEGGKTMRGTLVTGSSGCTVCVWDLWTEAAEVRAVLRGHGGGVLGVLDLRIDRRWIVSCSKDAVVRVWGRESLELERVLRGHEGPVNAVGLESGEYDDADAGDESEGDVGYGEGNRSQRHEGRVVSASGDGKMILWDIKSGERVRTFEGHDRGLACIEFKGDLIISGSNDCKIKIWSASTGACLRTLVGHEALVRALAFDPSSGRLVSASYDRSVRVWDLGALCGAGSGGAAGASAGGGSGAMRVVRDSHTSHIFDVKFDGRRIVRPTHPIGNTATYAYTEAAANPTRSLALPHDALPPLLHDVLPPPLSSPHLGRSTHGLYSSGSAFRFLDLLHFLAPFLSFLASSLIERFLGSDSVLVWVE